MSQGLLPEQGAVSTLRDFFGEKPFLVFGTGVSCALDSRFGMPTLKDVLLSAVGPKLCSATQRTQWEAMMAALDTGTDLETALNSVADRGLLRLITQETGEHIARVDREYALLIAQGEVEWPGTRLLKRLVEGLPEADAVLHALTPNYDMLFEHGCDCAGIPYTNGFVGGIERSIDWQAAGRTLCIPARYETRRRPVYVYKKRKHVRLYKVHGSLNYFYHRNRVVENNAWMWDPPDYAQRVLITPGLSKFEMLQRYRQELLQTADRAIERAGRFLFVGYGFHDRHLEEYISRKLKNHACTALIITRSSNPRIEALLEESPNTWLICRSDDTPGTAIRHRECSIDLPGLRLWDIREFTDHILGG